MTDPVELMRFYEHAYRAESAESEVHARWRALGAVGKAEHIIKLCSAAGIAPASTLEVGCGDGALLSALRRRAFGGRLAGVEISHSAVAIARSREEIDSVEAYDGLHLQAPDRAFELGVLSHVLEHVPDPAALLRETARVCRAVLVEVPLEANVSARRRGKRAHAQEVGHLQRLDRSDVRALAARAGLSLAGELDDPLPLAVHNFFAVTRRARAAAVLKWAARAALHRLSPALARRIFTVHYACLCVPGG